MHFIFENAESLPICCPPVFPFSGTLERVRLFDPTGLAGWGDGDVVVVPWDEKIENFDCPALASDGGREFGDTRDDPKDARLVQVRMKFADDIVIERQSCREALVHLFVLRCIGEWGGGGREDRCWIR